MKTELTAPKIVALAAQYERDGFHVLVQPELDAVPFDLDRYRPDLLATRGDEHHIVEVRELGTSLPVERFQRLAEEIGRHTGWRFMLVTVDDENRGELPRNPELPSWEQLRGRMSSAVRLINLGETEPAILSLWTVFEGMLRLQARRIDLPVERFPTDPLLRHMYSHGELSIGDYDRAMDLLDVRNSIVHGFATDNVDGAAAGLLSMVQEIFHEWCPQSMAT